MTFLTAAAVEERLRAGERDGKRVFTPSEDGLTDWDSSGQSWEFIRETQKAPEQKREQWDGSPGRAVRSLVPRWVLPIYMTADRLFKSSHGHVWLQQVQTLVRIVTVAVPVCAGEVLDHRLLSGQKTLSLQQIKKSHTVRFKGESASHVVRRSLNLGLCRTERLRQLSHILLTRHQHRRLPAIPETQYVWRKRVILRPLQPQDKMSHVSSVLFTIVSKQRYRKSFCHVCHASSFRAGWYISINPLN